MSAKYNHARKNVNQKLFEEKWHVSCGTCHVKKEYDLDSTSHSAYVTCRMKKLRLAGTGDGPNLPHAT